MSHPHAMHLSAGPPPYSTSYHYASGPTHEHMHLQGQSQHAWGYATPYAAPVYDPSSSSTVSPTQQQPGAMPPAHVPNGIQSIHAHPYERTGSIVSETSPSSANAVRPMAAAKKKRSRSPSQDKSVAGSKRPSGILRRNSSCAGTAKTIEKDGQTTTIFQCRGFGNCNMTFTRSEHLARHIRKHTGERPFQCHCGKSFSRLDNLRQHAQTVHADETARNEAMMQELTNLHASLAASAAQAQHAQALIVPKTDGTTSSPPLPKKAGARQPKAMSKDRKNSKQSMTAGYAPAEIGSLSGYANNFHPLATSAADSSRVDTYRRSLPSAQLVPSPSSSEQHPYHFSSFGHPGVVGYRNSDPNFAYGSTAPANMYDHFHGSLHDEGQRSLNTEQTAQQQKQPISANLLASRNSYPFDSGMEMTAGSAPFASRSNVFYGRDEQQSSPHQDWQASPSRRNSLQPNGIDSSSLNGLPPPPPTYGNLFSDQYAGFQSTLSANQVRTSTLANAHPLSPSLPPTSHGRPPTASDRPVLPPLTASSGSLSRPGTSSGALTSFLPPLSPTQTPSGRPLSSHGDAWFRPPTASGDLGKAFRFQRRSSMLDLPEMNLDSRPASSAAAMPPPEGAPPHSRGGGGVSRGSLTFSNGSLGEKLRPLSSSGRLGSAASFGTGSLFGESSKAPSTFGASPSKGPEAAERKTSPSASSPFRFQPPPLARQGASTTTLASAGSSTAASFFKDRPLTSQAARSVATNGASAGDVDNHGGLHTPVKRTARFESTDSDSRELPKLPSLPVSPALGARERVLKNRPSTSGDLLPSRRFGSPPPGKDTAASEARGQSHSAQRSPSPVARPDSSRRVSIASLVGKD